MTDGATRLVEYLARLLKEKFPEVRLEEGIFLRVQPVDHVSLVDEFDSALKRLLAQEPQSKPFRVVVIAEHSFVYDVKDGDWTRREARHDEMSRPVNQPSGGIAFTVIEDPGR